MNEKMIPRYNPAGYSVGMEAAHEGEYVRFVDVEDLVKRNRELDLLAKALGELAKDKDTDRIYWRDRARDAEARIANALA